MKNKKTIFLIFATLATIVLAVIAVVTSMRLKELATVPVTPNAPVSNPQAFDIVEEPSTTLSAGICETTFIVRPEAEPLSCFEEGCQNDGQCLPEGGVALECAIPYDGGIGKCVNPACSSRSNCICENGLACTTKSAYKTSVSVANKLVAGGNISRGDTVVYEISYENTGDTTNTATITDVIPLGFEFVSAETPCVYTALTRTVTCSGISVAKDEVGTILITVRVLADATAGTMDNSATVTPTLGTASTCDIALELVVAGPTPTPTPTPTSTPAPKCNDACDANNDCPSSLRCVSGFCRNEQCSSETDCGCPLSCNDYCANTAECPSGFTCLGNQCRNAECPSDNDCACENPPGCNETCNPNNATNECVGGYTCDATTNTCRNSTCTGETDCTCAIAGTITAPVETLPTAGNPIPGFLFLGAGALLLILGVLAVGL